MVAPAMDAVNVDLAPGSFRADHYFLIQQAAWSPLCRSLLLWHFGGKNSLIPKLKTVHPLYSQLYLYTCVCTLSVFGDCSCASVTEEK